MDHSRLFFLKVRTENGQEVFLSSFWKDTTIVLVFVRHFSSEICRRHARALWERREEFEDSGARILFVGDGDAGDIANFRKELGFKARVVLDSGLKSFEVFDIESGVVAVRSDGRIIFRQGIDLYAEVEVSDLGVLR